MLNSKNYLLLCLMATIDMIRLIGCEQKTILRKKYNLKQTRKYRRRPERLTLLKSLARYTEKKEEVEKRENLVPAQLLTLGSVMCI